MSSITRRSATLLGFAGLTSGLAACSGDAPMFGSVSPDASAAPRRNTPRNARLDRVYAALEGEAFGIPAFDYTVMAPETLRSNVAYPTGEQPGTIVIDPHAHALFYVEGDGRATRYGVGVGREGFLWNGRASINVRKAWPDWVPPREMIERDPAIQAQLTDTPRGRGVPAGPKNPMAARAMILAANGRDTGYRIHGTWEPETIGTNVSSGCIRMINQDIVHLYGRTTQTNPVVVMA